MILTCFSLSTQESRSSWVHTAKSLPFICRFGTVNRCRTVNRTRGGVWLSCRCLRVRWCWWWYLRLRCCWCWCLRLRCCWCWHCAWTQETKGSCKRSFPTSTSVEAAELISSSRRCLRQAMAGLNHPNTITDLEKSVRKLSRDWNLGAAKHPLLELNNIGPYSVKRTEKQLLDCITSAMLGSIAKSLKLLHQTVI